MVGASVVGGGVVGFLGFFFFFFFFFRMDRFATVFPFGFRVRIQEVTAGTQQWDGGQSLRYRTAISGGGNRSQQGGKLGIVHIRPLTTEANGVEGLRPFERLTRCAGHAVASKLEDHSVTNCPSCISWKLRKSSACKHAERGVASVGSGSRRLAGVVLEPDLHDGRQRGRNRQGEEHADDAEQFPADEDRDQRDQWPQLQRGTEDAR